MRSPAPDPASEVADAALVEEMAPDWAIRPEQPVDIDQIHELHRASFPGAAEAELVDAVRASAGFIPELSLVATSADGSVLGHVMISRVGLELGGEPEAGAPRQSEPLDVLALAPVAVLPPHRERGIGTALMRAALVGADQRPEPLVVVLGSPAFYGRFGFSSAAAYGVTGPYDVPDEVYQVRPRPGIDELPEGRVTYPPAFSGV